MSAKTLWKQIFYCYYHWIIWVFCLAQGMYSCFCIHPYPPLFQPFHWRYQVDFCLSGINSLLLMPCRSLTGKFQGFFCFSPCFSQDFQRMFSFRGYEAYNRLAEPTTDSCFLPHNLPPFFRRYFLIQALVKFFSFVDFVESINPVLCFQAILQCPSS